MGDRTYLVTGASGLLGKELLRAIQHRDPGAPVHVLLRAEGQELAARARALGLAGLAAGSRAVSGDLTRPRLGLEAREVERLAGEVTHVLHAGASVRFDLPWEEARQVNVVGTLQMLDLAARFRRLERLVHVSTAYSCGETGDVLLESPAPAGRFRNTYERSKHDAERVLARRMSLLPITVVRPSIVAPAAGRSEPAHFLLLLKLYLERGWHWVPGLPSSLVDLVPADLIAAAIVGLARRPRGDGRWLNLAAGPRAATLEQLGRLAARAFGARPLSFAPPGILRAALRAVVWGERRRALERAAPFVPYLSVRTRIDVTDSRRVLAELGLEMPWSTDVFQSLLASLPRRRDDTRDRAGDPAADGAGTGDRSPAPARPGGAQAARPAGPAGAA